MSHYTDEELQAVRDELPFSAKFYCRAVLDAVAPAIVARAKAEALREAADKMAAAEPSSKFASGWSTAEVAIRVRADDIERGAS